MSIASAHVPVFRDLWADRFVDSCSIERTTDRGAYNATTHTYDSPTVVPLYTGGCLVRASSDEDLEFGEEETHRLEADIYLPWNTTGLEVEDRVTVTAVDADSDPDLVGTVWVITGVNVDTYTTRRHVTAELDQGRGNP